METGSLFVATKVPVGSLDPLCSELIVQFGNDASYGLTPPVRVRLTQYLDDPYRCRPLLKETDLTRIVNSIRVGLCAPSVHSGMPQLVSLSSVFASLDPASMDKVLETPPWSKDNPNPLYALVMESYPLWSCFIPALKTINKNILAAMFLYKKRLPSCTLVPKFDGIFTYQPKVIRNSSGDATSILAGNKDFYDFGFLKVESSFWKLFWSTVIQKKPEYDRKLEWNLRTSYDDGDDIGIILFTLTYVLAREEHKHLQLNDVRVGIVWDDDDEGWCLNIWSAIICAFAHVRQEAWRGDRGIGDGPFPSRLLLPALN